MYNTNYLDDAINETKMLDLQNPNENLGRNIDKIKTATKAQLTKTLNTMGLDTNVFMGTQLMLHDPLVGMSNKFNLTLENFNVRNILQAGFESGDVQMLNQVQEDAFFQRAAVQKKLAREGLVRTSRYDLETRRLDFKDSDGSFIVNAKSIVEQMHWMKQMLKAGEFEKFEQNLVDMAQSTGKNMSKDDLLKHSFLRVPPQMRHVLKTMGNDAQTKKFVQSVIGKTFKVLNRV